MEIVEFKDGYYITYEGKDYMYYGKTTDVVKSISEKVRELLSKK